MMKIVSILTMGLVLLTTSGTSKASDLNLISNPYAHDQELYEKKKNEALTSAHQRILDEKGGILAEEALSFVSCYRTGMSVDGFSKPNDIIWQFHIIYSFEQTVNGIVLVNETQKKIRITAFRNIK
jgi:hypothetical protein